MNRLDKLEGQALAMANDQVLEYAERLSIARMLRARGREDFIKEERQRQTQASMYPRT